MEEQWEIGDKSPVADASFRNLMCVVLKLEAFRRESRTFASMALDCYFDICMALPRMVLICSIPDKVSSPAGCRAFALATQFRRCIKTGDQRISIFFENAVVCCMRAIFDGSRPHRDAFRNIRLAPKQLGQRDEICDDSFGGSGFGRARLLHSTKYAGDHYR